METKKIIIGIFTALSIMLLAGCGGSDNADFQTDSGTPIANCTDGSPTTVTAGQTIELADSSTYTLLHNQDGTKTICITSGSGTIY